MDGHEISYRFVIDGGRVEHFMLKFHPDTFEVLAPADQPPEWAALEYEQCDNCSLSPTHAPYCPLARALVDPVTRFADVLSYTPVAVEVETEERTVSFQGSAQDAVSPLFGLLSAASGCPRTAPFRPMARFHLPFASQSETVYRAASMYLLAQYFRYCDGEAVDLGMSGLLDIYTDIEKVNVAVARRLRSAAAQDSAVNAIILLDLFAKTFPVAVESSLEEFKHLYLYL
jgi:hypothetical protein